MGLYWRSAEAPPQRTDPQGQGQRGSSTEDSDSSDEEIEFDQPADPDSGCTASSRTLIYYIIIIHIIIKFVKTVKFVPFILSQKAKNFPSKKITFKKIWRGIKWRG